MSKVRGKKNKVSTLRPFWLSHQLFIVKKKKKLKVFSCVFFFPLMMWRLCQTTTRVLRLDLEMPQTPTKGLSNVCLGAMLKNMSVVVVAGKGTRAKGAEREVEEKTDGGERDACRRREAERR